MLFSRGVPAAILLILVLASLNADCISITYLPGPDAVQSPDTGSRTPHARTGTGDHRNPGSNTDTPSNTRMEDAAIRVCVGLSGRQ